VFRRVDELDDPAWRSAWGALDRDAHEALAGEGHARERIRLKRSADLRYAGQAYELTVPVGHDDDLDEVAQRFHVEHERTYGHRSDGDPVDVVSLRVYAQVVREGGGDYAALSAAAGRGTAAAAATRRAYFGPGAGFRDTPVIGRAALGAAWREGPLIVEEYDATCVVPPGARARLDPLGNIELEIPPEDAS
jgi:N-methylhydantoinase A